MPENVVVAVQQALVGCVQEPASGLDMLGVKQPTGENSSSQVCLRKDGSVQLQWAPGTKTAALAQVPVGPDGRRVCWAEWCWVPCDRLSCPHWHGSEDPEGLAKIVPDGFSLGVCALACERLGLKDRFPGLKRFPNMGDLFQAQLWLRAVLASSYRLSGSMPGCGGAPVQVQFSISSAEVAKYTGSPHPEGVAVSQFGSIGLVSSEWLWSVIDWGEKYLATETACVSLVGSAALGQRPRELEERALQFAAQVGRSDLPQGSWPLVQEIKRQLEVRVGQSSGLLTPDVWRIWLPMFEPGTALVLLQVHTVGALRPVVFKVPGVPVKRYVGALMMDSHLMELRADKSVSEVEAWLEQLPMFVPTLWCFEPAVVSQFGYEGPFGKGGVGACTGSIEEPDIMPDLVDDDTSSDEELDSDGEGEELRAAGATRSKHDTLWELGEFDSDSSCWEESTSAAEFQMVKWPEECAAEFLEPSSAGSGIKGCGRLESRDIAADLSVELEQMEVSRPMGTGTQSSSCKLSLQGVKLEVDCTATSKGVEGLWEWLPGLEVKGAQPVATPAGTTGSKQPAAVPPLEWESMWDEVTHNICDGRVLDAAASSRMKVLKDKAADCARTWSSQLGKQLAADRCLQQKYLRNTEVWVYLCLEAAELVGGKHEWPPLLEASIRDGTGTFTGEVDLNHLKDYFARGVVSPEQIDLMVEQVVKGQALNFRERRVRFRGKNLPSCKGFEREIAAQNWVDASRGQVVIAGPECLPAMDAGEIMCHPNARVPKNDTATGEPTGKGRLIAHLSFQPIKADVLKWLSRNQSVERPFGTYNLSRHREVARQWCQLNDQPLGGFIAAQKNDGDCYFRRWYMAVMNVGDIASEFAGHTVIDRSLVFGLGPSPEVTHFGGTEPMEKAMNGAWVELDEELSTIGDSVEVVAAAAAVEAAKQGCERAEAIEAQKPTDVALMKEAMCIVVGQGALPDQHLSMLKVAKLLNSQWQLASEWEWEYPEAVAYLKAHDPLWNIPVEQVDADVVLGMKTLRVLTDQEVIDAGAQGRVVPTSGVMYVDDQICLAVVCLAIHLAMRSHAAEGIVARLGKQGLSMKAVHKEMVFRVVQNVIGQLCDCIKGEWRPTPTRVMKLDRYLAEYLVKVKARKITAGEAYAPYSLGLWVGIGAWWLKAFIHGLKTPLNGFDTGSMSKDDLVTPNRKGLSVGEAWLELEDHVMTLQALSALRRKLPWRTSMVQMLEVSERLLQNASNFMRVETDACIWGAGGVNEKLKQFFRIVHPGWVRAEIRHAMDNGLDQQTAQYYTIALVELAAVFVSHFLWAGRTDEMGKILDIWNVVDNTNTEAWCEKLWAGPVKASKFLRGLAVIGMRRKYNSATSGERTKAMVFADPLSRVWEGGVYDPTAMTDFAEACEKVEILNGMKEVVLDDTFIHQIVYQKAGSEVGTLKEQLARLMTSADGPEAPTVLWDSKADCPLEHCLKELPSKEEVDAAVLAKSAKKATGIQVVKESKVPEPSSSGAAAAAEQLVITEELPLSVDPEDKIVIECEQSEVPSAGLKALGTRQVQLWDVGAHVAANAAALADWQSQVKVKFYTDHPAVDRTKAATEEDATWRCQAGFSQAELEPLLSQRYWWKRRPTLTAICYGVLGSTMGWIAEGFEFTAGSEIEEWCVKHAGKLFPHMKQLGDLVQMSAADMTPSDVLIVGTTCTAVSILGMQRGLADIKMEHMLMVAREAVKVGYKAMVFEMVPNILGYDRGAIQIVLENILRAAGYEVSRRVENLWDHGGAAVRERLYTIATNPCYGKHSDLAAETEKLRQPTDPKIVADVMDPVEMVDPSLFHSLEQVRWKAGKLTARAGKPCWAGSMYGGGIGYRGVPGRVLLGVGALTTVIASGNVGAVLATSSLTGEWYLRELAAHELKQFNTLCKVLELPVDHKQALRAVGNCEPPRMAQSMARSVIGPWLENSEEERPGRVPVATPERVEPVARDVTWNDVVNLGETPVSVRETMSRMRPRVKTGLMPTSTELKPVRAQRTVRQQEAFRALQLKHQKEQMVCGGMLPCCGGMPDGAQARIAAAIAGPSQVGTLRAQVLNQRQKGVHVSGVERLYPPIDPKDNRHRSQIRKADPRIEAARVKIEAASIRSSTSSKYSGQWKEYVAHCDDFEEDPLQSGKNEKQITEHMVYFALHRYEFAGNAFGTIRGYLSAIRWYFLEADLADPTKGNWLVRVMRGIKNLRGAVSRKLPVTLEMLEWIWKRRGIGLTRWKAIATAVVLQVFFLLRISDFGAQDSRTVSEFILKVHQVKFWNKGKRCKWSEEPDEVSIEGDGDKVSNQPWYRNHFATGGELCPVRAMAEWFCLIDGKVSGECPVFTVPPADGERVQAGDQANALCVSRLEVCQAIKAAAVANGDKAASYSSHSGRIGGATLLLKAGAPVSMIKLAGRWKGDTWSIYSRMTHTVMHGVAADMIGLKGSQPILAENVRVR